MRVNRIKQRSRAKEGQTRAAGAALVRHRGARGACSKVNHDSFHCYAFLSIHQNRQAITVSDSSLETVLIQAIR